jgi:hypothetical protein
MTTKAVSKKSVKASVAPSSAEIAECLDHLDAVATLLSPYMAALTATQRKRLTKGRKEVEAAVPQLATLAQRFEVASSSVDVETMQTEVALASSLVPVIGRTRTLLGALSDTVNQARGNACVTATTVHSFLRRLATQNSTLKGELSTVSGAFARTKKKAPAAQPAPAAPAAEALATAAPVVGVAAQPAATTSGKSS